jgi:hypothetical protein
MKIKTPKLRELKKIADEMFSIIIRKSNTNYHGYNYCFVCGRFTRWEYLQCGHFSSRGNYKSRYSEINCKPICPECNRKQKYGDKEIERIFREKLIRIHGEEEVNKLQKDYKIHKLFVSDYLEMIEEFTERIAELG